jgi:hypothetical protein
MNSTFWLLIHFPIIFSMFFPHLHFFCSKYICCHDFRVASDYPTKEIIFCKQKVTSIVEMFLKSFFLSIGCHHKTLILPLNPMAKWVHGISSTLAYLTMFTNIGIFMLQEKCNKIFLHHFVFELWVFIEVLICYQPIDKKKLFRNISTIVHHG